MRMRNILRRFKAVRVDVNDDAYERLPDLPHLISSLSGKENAYRRA